MNKQDNDKEPDGFGDFNQVNSFPADNFDPYSDFSGPPKE